MKENNNSDSESEEDNNEKNNDLEIIDTSSKNKEPKKSLIKEERISIEKKEEEEEEKEEEEEIDINLQEVKLGSKIMCPEDNCFLNAIIEIEPVKFQIRTNCGKHKKTMKILNFAAKAGKLKEESESCSNCNKTYKDLEEKKNKLYRCYCGKNICENCKKNHLIEKDLEEHNMVEFTKKDYTCFCKNSNKKFIIYCLDCKKNACILCQNHKQHKTKSFRELIILGKDEKKEMKKKLEKQKEKIDKIKTIIDNWLIKTQKFFEIYKKNLDLYWEINNIIFKKYNTTKNFYEEIKNIENIRDDFDENFLNLLKSENDFKKQNEIILKFLNENEKNKIIKANKKEKIAYKLEKLSEQKFGGEVKNICELKKDNFLAVNISILKEGNRTEELHVYTKSEKNNYDQIFSITAIEGGKINSLSELRNGNLLAVQKKFFKVIEIAKQKKEINIIQNRNLEVENIMQIIELINGCLASISQIPNEGSNIILWEKNLISNEYEIEEKKNPKTIAVHIMELNNDSFLVFFIDGLLSIYNSKTSEEKKKLSRIKNVENNINKTTEIKKMIKINDENILFIYQKCALIYNILLKETTKVYPFNFDIYDISRTPNYNIYFSNYFDNGKYGLIHLLYNSFIQKIDLNAPILEIHTNVITCIKLLNDGNLVTGSLDKSMKSWKIKILKYNEI